MRSVMAVPFSWSIPAALPLSRKLQFSLGSETTDVLMKDAADFIDGHRMLVSTVAIGHNLLGLHAVQVRAGVRNEAI